MAANNGTRSFTSSLLTTTLTSTIFNRTNGTNTTTLISNSTILTSLPPLTSSSPISSPLTSSTAASRAVFVPNARVGPIPSPPRMRASGSSHSPDDSIIFPSGRDNSSDPNNTIFETNGNDRVVVVSVLFGAVLFVGVVVVGAVLVNGRRTRRRQKMKVERLLGGKPDGAQPWTDSSLYDDDRVHSSPIIVYGAGRNTIDSDSSGSNQNPSTPDGIYFNAQPRDKLLPPVPSIEDHIWEANKRHSRSNKRTSFLGIMGVVPRSKSTEELHPNASRYASSSDANLAHLNIMIQNAERQVEIAATRPAGSRSESPIPPGPGSAQSDHEPRLKVVGNRASATSFQFNTYANRASSVSSIQEPSPNSITPPKDRAGNSVVIGRGGRVRSRGSFGSPADVYPPHQIDRSSFPDLTNSSDGSGAGGVSFGSTQLMTPPSNVLYAYVPSAPSSPVIPPKGLDGNVPPPALYYVPTTMAQDGQAVPLVYYYIPPSPLQANPESMWITESNPEPHVFIPAESKTEPQVVVTPETPEPTQKHPSPTIQLFEATDEEEDDLMGADISLVQLAKLNDHTAV